MQPVPRVGWLPHGCLFVASRAPCAIFSPRGSACQPVRHKEEIADKVFFFFDSCHATSLITLAAAMMMGWRGMRKLLGGQIMGAQVVIITPRHTRFGQWRSAHSPNQESLSQGPLIPPLRTAMTSVWRPGPLASS